jgi:hypothetical protein
MLDTILDILEYILYSAERLNLSYESVQNVLDVVSSITKINSIGTEFKASTMIHAKALYTSFASFAVSDMVGGQTGIQTVSNNIRFSTGLASVSSGISSTSALSSLEDYLGLKPQSISFAGSSDASESDYISVTMIETPSSSTSTNSTTTLLSNPMTVVLGGSPCATSSTNGCYAEVVLRLNDNFMSNTNEESVVVTTECMSGDVTTKTAVCPYGTEIPVTCEGNHRFFQTICPIKKYAAVCGDINGELNSCYVSANTSTSVTCRCLVSPAERRSAVRRRSRRLETDDIDDQDTPAAASSVEFVAVLDTTLSSFVQTWSSAHDLTLSSVAQSWDVLVTIGMIGIISMVSLVMSTYADKRDNKVETDTKVAEKATNQLSYNQKSREATGQQKRY